jgi:hypothetical protein
MTNKHTIKRSDRNVQLENEPQDRKALGRRPQRANNHGYAEGTVREVLRRWSHKKCEPLGGVSRDIMRDIRKTLEDEITPEMAEAV